MPTAIFGVSFPSLGAAGTWAAARGTSAAGVNATAPRISMAVLRENFMIRDSLSPVKPASYQPTAKSDREFLFEFPVAASIYQLTSLVSELALLSS